MSYLPPRENGSGIRRLSAGAGLVSLALVAAACAVVSPTKTIAPPHATRSVVAESVDGSHPVAVDSAPVLRVIEQPPPSAPGVKSMTKLGQLKLAWDASPDASVVGYKLYYGTNSRSYYASAAVGNTLTATLVNLDEGRRYYVAATAYNAAGDESVYSNEANGVTPIYVQLYMNRWSVQAYGLFGRTNRMQSSTNLATWQTILTWVGDGQLTNVLQTNATQSWFRVEGE